MTEGNVSLYPVAQLQGVEWASWISTLRYHSTTVTCDIFLAGMQASLTREKTEHGGQFLGTEAGRLVSSKMVLGKFLIWFPRNQDSGLGWERKDSRQWLLNNV